MESNSIKLIGVKEYSENYDVEISSLPRTDFRWVIRAINEGGNNETLIDFWGLIDWLKFGPIASRDKEGFHLPLDGEE